MIPNELVGVRSINVLCLGESSSSSPILPLICQSDAIVVAAEKKRKFGRIIEETQKRSIDVGITLESNHDRKRSDKKITKPPRKSERNKKRKKQYSNQSGYIKEGVCTHTRAH